MANTCGMSTEVSADENEMVGEFEHEHWFGSAFVSKSTNEFQYCLVDAIFEPDVFVGFIHDSEGILLVLATEKWRLKDDEPFPISLSLDSQWRQKTTGYPSKTEKENRWQVEIPIEDTKTAIEKFKASQIVSIVAPRNRFKFRLSGISGALEKLEQCYRTYGNPGTAKKNP